MMTKRGFGKRLALGAILVALSAPSVLAQQGEVPQKAGRPLNAGDVLSGELNALKIKSAKPGQARKRLDQTLDFRTGDGHQFTTIMNGLTEAEARR